MACIAIDGPCGSGKSTVSRILAEKLGFTFVDTGALYRTIAYYFKLHNVDYTSPSKVEKALKDIEIELKVLDHKQKIYLNSIDVSNRIRSEEISTMASSVSAIPEVRTKLLSIQRELANQGNVIMDGRDIGTVIMPNADLKIFLTARPEVRAGRRLEQLGMEENKFDQVLKDLLKRDEQDSKREISPLKIAEDAVVFDNSKMTQEETLNKLLDLIKRRLGS